MFSILFALLIPIIGCENISYYGQAVKGQVEILASRESIIDLVEEPDLNDKVRAKLQLVLEVREFAKTELALPVGGSYSSYVDLMRPYVVWNIVAVPELSLTPITWCYPIVGCASYRGYFSEQAAREYADGLVAEKNDVFLGGVSAYSTLGFFDDPILNTFLRRSDDSLAGLIFHELAHQVLYVQGDTTFNESFANAVEQEGLKRWRKAKGRNSQQINNRESLIKRRQAFIELVLRYRDQLQVVFSDTNLSEQEKRDQKQLIYSNLRLEYETGYKAKYNGYRGYDNWFNDNLNNAKLVTVSTYEDLVPEFLKLIEKNSGDMLKFYDACRGLTKLDKTTRRQRLAELF